MTAKITSKGQVTIPRKIRDMPKSNTVEFELIGGSVIMRPVSSVGGALSAHAKGRKAMRKVRDKVWEEVAQAQGQVRKESSEAG